MNPNFDNPLNNPRMYKYQNLLANIDSYLSSIAPENEELSIEQASEFPAEDSKSPEEYAEYFARTIKTWLKMYDENILGNYDQEKATLLHDPDLCIPCHIGIPKDQPLYIQYLYCIQEPEEIDPTSMRSFTKSRLPKEDRTMPYEDIVRGVELLDGSDKEKFLYELRLGFLESVTNGNGHYLSYKEMKDLGPERYYEPVLQNEAGEATAGEKALYESLVKIAHEGKMHDFEDQVDMDYSFELDKESDEAVAYFRIALYQLKLMRDLISKK